MNTAHTIRKMLRANASGMTAQEIAAEFRTMTHQRATNVLKNMPDAYIFDWVKMHSGAGRKSALWKVVVPPPNARNVK